MDFRKLLSEHGEQALEIVKACYPHQSDIHTEFSERFAASLNPQKGSYSVNFIGGFEDQTLQAIGGYAMSSMTDSCWELSWACVLPKFRNQGIGKNLVQFRIKEILEITTTQQTYILVHARESIAFSSLGFQKSFDADLNKPVLWKRIK